MYKPVLKKKLTSWLLWVRCNPADALLAIQGDVRQYESVAQAVQTLLARFGRLDILVNNAAGNFLCPAKDLSANGFKTGTLGASFNRVGGLIVDGMICTVIDIDLNGTFNSSKYLHSISLGLLLSFNSHFRAAYEALKSSGSGVIINISATLHYGATPWQLHASSAKAGIDALTRNLGAASHLRMRA